MFLVFFFLAFFAKTFAKEYVVRVVVDPHVTIKHEAVRSPLWAAPPPALALSRKQQHSTSPSPGSRRRHILLFIVGAIRAVAFFVKPPARCLATE
jgi:hypothetical protein